MPQPRYSSTEHKAWQKSCKFTARIWSQWASVFSTFLLLHIRGSIQLYEQSRPETGNLVEIFLTAKCWLLFNDKQSVKEVCWRGQRVHLCIKNWAESNEILWEIQSTVLHKTFQGKSKAKKGQAVFVQGLVCYLKWNIFAVSLLENMPWLTY